MSHRDSNKSNQRHSTNSRHRLFWSQPLAKFHTPLWWRTRSRLCVGVSLFECLVALCVIAAISAAAVPSLFGTVEGTEAATIARRLHISLAMARSAAIKRRHSVTVCAAAHDYCSEPTHWARGWIIFADVDGNGQRDSSETLLWRENLFDSRLRLVLVAGASADRFIRFGARGFGWPNGTFHICSGKRPLRRVVMYRSGRSRIARPTPFLCQH